jgi:transcriptional antiterminator RfaH
MKDQRASNDPHWYLIHTHPKQEERAEGNLMSFGVETLAPRLKERRLNSYTGKAVCHVKPLFPSYIFAKFRIDDLYSKVRYPRGIRRLVSFGDEPAVIDEEIITVIRSRVAEDGFAMIAEDLKPGDDVIISDGPFKNFAGVFEREMKGPDRVRILLQTVSYQAHIEIEREMVWKIGNSGSC